MKILSIGNSFSQDSHRWLYDVAQANGYSFDTVNLYIGGCSLETHCNNLNSGELSYEMQGNSGEFVKMVSLKEALESEKYDVVTLQQVSGLSGKPQSFFPFLIELADSVRKKQCDAKLFFHRTWSYEFNAKHPDFLYYNRDRGEMYRRIYDASVMAANVIGADIIPSGDVIQFLGENTKEFNYKNGGISLYRDGFHLSFDYGRFAAACVWCRILSGRQIAAEKFLSKNSDFNADLVKLILDSVNTL